MPRIVRRAKSGIGNDSSGIIVMDEGTQVGDSIHTLNFVGSSIRVFEGSSGIAYITSPEESLSSHFNSEDGESNGFMQLDGMNVQSRFIGLPAFEGSPFHTGGFGGSIDLATNEGIIKVRTIEPVSAMQNSKFLIEFLDMNGTTIDQYETPEITGSAVFTSDNTRFTAKIENYAFDVFKTKANVKFEVKHANILLSNGFNSGKFDIRVTHTVADGTGPHVFLLSQSETAADFFYDGSTQIPTISGDVVVSQVASETKHVSGLEYYTTGSSIGVSFTGLNNFNRDTALTENGVVLNGYQSYGVSSRSASPISGYSGSSDFSGWSSSFDANDVSYSNTFDIDRLNFYFAGNGEMTVNVYDSWASIPESFTSDPQKILIDTSTQQSTNLIEYFSFENMRTDESFSSWNSETPLRDNVTGSIAGISVVDNSSLISGDTVTLQYSQGGSTGSVIINFETNVDIGIDAAETVSNIVSFLNQNHSDKFSALVSPYSSSSMSINTVDLGPQTSLANSSDISPFVLGVSDFEGGSNDAMAYFGKMIDPSQTTLSNGSSNTDWSLYSPSIGGDNPNYGVKSGDVAFYRKFIDSSGLSRTSMSISFIGTFASSATEDLETGDLKIFVQKINSETMGGISGMDAPLMRFHGPMFGEMGSFDQGVTVEGSYIREDSSNGNEAMATFGTYKCTGGIYIKILICNPVIQIERMDVVFY